MTKRRLLYYNNRIRLLYLIQVRFARRFHGNRKTWTIISQQLCCYDIIIAHSGGTWISVPLKTIYNIFVILEKYSRGRRGAPAKGVGRVTVARVQIPPSPPKALAFCKCFLFCVKRAPGHRCAFFAVTDSSFFSAHSADQWRWHWRVGKTRLQGS